MNMNTTDILQKTIKLVSGSRHDQHGDIILNHENIAMLWTGYLGNKFKLNLVILPEDVAKLMSLLKIARTQQGSFNLDDYVDAAAYSAIAGEIANKRQIQISATLGEKNAKSKKSSSNK